MYCDSSILYCFLLKLKTNSVRNLLYSYIFLNVYFVKISQTPSIWFKVKETILVWQRYPQKNHFVLRSQNVHSGFHARGRADAFKESKPSALPWLPEAPAVHTAARLVACMVQSWPPHMLEGLCEEMQSCLLSRIYHHIHWFRDAEKTLREVLELVLPHRLTSWQAVTSSGCEQFTRCLVSHVLEKVQGLPTSLLVK